MIVMKMYLISCNLKTHSYMSGKGKVVLQNCVDFLKVEPGLSDKSCPLSSPDGDQAIDIKVEASETQEVEDPLLITLPDIKVEHEVSCMPACPPLSIYHIYPELCIVFPISICISTSPVLETFMGS
jgi:hypothetical protein